MKSVSIILPSIRPENLEKFYKSAIESCKKYTFDIIIPSPYLIPESLMATGNVKFIHTYAAPTVACQLATLLCNSEYLYNTTDDGLLQPNAIDIAIDKFKSLSDIDIINMRYRENALDATTLEKLPDFTGDSFPLEYWKVAYCSEYWKPGIDRDWQVAPHFLMKLKYFYFLGGYDCIFEYLNHALHDLIFRSQSHGSKITVLETDAFLCSHLPERTGDHGPIHDAQTGPDKRNFNEIYKDANAPKNRIQLNYDNWKDYPSIWERRFGKNDLKVKKFL